MTSFLPQSEGYLPYFLLYTSVSAGIHTAVCYLSPAPTALKQFSGPEHPAPIGLLARTYGIKNIYTALIRGFAAYHITNPPVYDLAICTFAGVLFLYASELVVYQTVRMREATIPFITAGGGLLWMALQRGWYFGLMDQISGCGFRIL